MDFVRDDEECLGDLGFMFDSFHSRSIRSFDFAPHLAEKVQLKCIDEDPGHVQSGQHLWPAAYQLSAYLCHMWQDRGAERQQQPCCRAVVELGAGCGMCGIVCAKLMAKQQHASSPNLPCRVCLTDYDPGSVALLEDNVKLNGFHLDDGAPAASDTAAADTDAAAAAVECGSSIRWSVRSLKWGAVDGGATCDPSSSATESSSSAGAAADSATKTSSSDSGRECENDSFDLVLGSDLIYCPEVVQPLFFTVDRMLCRMDAGGAESIGGGGAEREGSRGRFLLACSFDIGEESLRQIEQCVLRYGLRRRLLVAGSAAAAAVGVGAKTVGDGDVLPPFPDANDAEEDAPAGVGLGVGAAEGQGQGEGHGPSGSAHFLIWEFTRA